VVGHEYSCTFCRSRPPAFERARSAARYRGSLRNVLQAFKYGGATCLSRELVAWLHACVTAHYDGLRFDGVAAVPLYARRERSRGYNQAALLAKGVANRMGVPFAAGCLQRVRATRTQTELKARERRQNVKGAFRVAHADWVDGRRILLVDDVMTTGATVSECSRVLRTAGAASVHVATVARG